MHPTLIRAFTVGAIAVGLATIAHAQKSGSAAQNVDSGKFEYGANCAVCHGLSGKGDGPFAEQLKSSTAVTNLTELSKKNNGAFPFMHVYETIDGRALVMAHGPRDMPIWGRAYMTERSDLYPDYVDYVPEEIVRAKILALTEYVYRLQAK
jgi:mono/diheme cytochrome c family protein